MTLTASPFPVRGMTSLKTPRNIRWRYLLAPSMEKRPASCGFRIRMCFPSFLARFSPTANPRPLRLPNPCRHSHESRERSTWRCASTYRGRKGALTRGRGDAKADPRLDPVSLRPDVVFGHQFFHPSADGPLSLHKGLRRAGLWVGHSKFFPAFCILGFAGCYSALRPDLPGEPRVRKDARHNSFRLRSSPSHWNLYCWRYM